jgi:hypothetical protein
VRHSVREQQRDRDVRRVVHALCRAEQRDRDM